MNSLMIPYTAQQVPQLATRGQSTELRLACTSEETLGPVPKSILFIAGSRGAQRCTMTVLHDGREKWNDLNAIP